uniref:cAMP responsive element modulator n=1 Tax=Scophthalmus maximus TaxID=52904 RepID=A0A8D3A1R5_SCOMX
MDASVSSHLDSSLNGSLTDGEEENHSEARPSPQVRLSDDGETVRVQGGAPAPQTSVIQSPPVQTAQIAALAELQDHESVADAQTRREILSRRPSYRQILSELSSHSPAVPKIDEDKSEEEEDEEEEEEEDLPVASEASAAPTSIYQTSSGQYIAVSQGRAIQLSGPGVEALQGAQMLSPGDAPQQFYIQGGQVLLQAATGDIPAYQLRSPNSGLAQSIVMAASPGAMHNPPPHAEEVTRKREVRLMKNREAARECRRKKKEYVKCLENRVAVLENQNKTLIEELKALKDIYCHKAE